MMVGEIIDLDNHNEIVKFMKNQSDKIKKLEKENEQLKKEILWWKYCCGKDISRDLE